MKEVIKVSIAGIAFALDKEAHKVIETYLNTLRNGYADNPDGSEIVADIEARIAELILTAQPADRVVERELTDKIVAQLGYPDDFEPVAETKSRMQKRLYRSAHGQKIGGVCSGLGVYFGIDPSWIRLGLFVPLMLSIIFSLFAATPPVVDPNAAAVTMVWSYIGELVFNMLILVGTVKMADRVVREMMGL